MSKENEEKEDYEFNFNDSIATYHHNSVGDKTQQTYMGEFKFKCSITPIDKIKMDRLYRELIGTTNPHMASKEALDYAFALSQLKYRIVESPNFFKNKELDGGHLDGNVVIDLINASFAAEEQYVEMNQERTRKVMAKLAESVRNGDIKKEEEFEDPIDSDDEIEIGEE